MANEETDRDLPDEGASDPAAAGPGGSDGAGPEMDRLPPPAFPPGSRRAAAPRQGVPVEEEGAGQVNDDELPDDAFISPDEPIRKEARGIPDDAFISPDDPFVPAEDEGEKGGGAGGGQVTGVGEERARVASATARRDDPPSIHELPYLLDRVAEQIQGSGAQALRVHHEMGHFEAALKSFLRGYLKGGGD